MLFWAVIAAGAGLVALVLGLAFARQGLGSDAALAVYRDQLAEVERDRARGVLTEAEAERVRVEVSRRLLDADRAAQAAPGAAEGPGRGAAVAVGVLIAGVALLGYWQLGAPGYVDQPLAKRLETAERALKTRPSQAEAEAQVPERQAEADADYLALMDRLRAAVTDRPDDLQGWTLLARNEAALGNYRAAHAAQRRVIGIKGGKTTSGDEAQLASLLILAAGGYVSPEAESALTRALKLEPTNPVARYYTGLLFAQTGRPDLAFRLWRPLMDESPPDAPWLEPIRAQIGQVAMLAGIPFEMPPERGPSADDVAAAAEMSPEDRAEMIGGMVARLEDRLSSEGGPAADWAKLISSLVVLEKRGHALEILDEARTRFAADPEGLKVIEAAAEAAGL